MKRLVLRLLCAHGDHTESTPGTNHVLGPSCTHLLGAGEGDPGKGVPVHDQGDALAQLLLN